MRLGRHHAAVALALSMVAVAGCGTEVNLWQSGEGTNDAERDVNRHAKSSGYALSGVKCPGMEGGREDNDGKSVDCTATAQMSDGSTQPVKLTIAYAKCSISNDSCQNIDITGDIRIRVRPN